MWYSIALDGDTCVHTVFKGLMFFCFFYDKKTRKPRPKECRNVFVMSVTKTSCVRAFPKVGCYIMQPDMAEVL